MVDELVKEKPEILLIGGDYVKHGLSSNDTNINNFYKMIPIFK